MSDSWDFADVESAIAVAEPATAQPNEQSTRQAQEPINNQSTNNQQAEEPSTGTSEAPQTEQTDPLAQTENHAPVLPDDLKPYETHLKAMKWDTLPPEKMAAQAIKSQMEMRKLQDQTAVKARTIDQKAKEINAVILSDVEKINEVRKRMGAPEILPAPDPKAQLAEIDSLYSMLVEASQNGDWSKVESHFDSKRRDLAIKDGIRQQLGGNAQKDFQGEFKNAAIENYQKMIASNPEAKNFIEEVSEHFNPGGLFDSLNIDVYQASASPERLQALLDIGQAIHVFKNLDKIVEEKAALLVSKRSNAAATGSTGKQRNQTVQAKNEIEDEFLAHLYAN